MKKYVLIGLILISIFGLTGCKNKNIEDAKKFKEEYESLNGTVREKDNKKNRSIKIDVDNPFVYSSAKQIVEKIEKKQTFYVYFGSASCPWCRSVIEKAIEIANKNKIDTIYYVDIWDKDGKEILRNVYTLNEDGSLIESISGTKEYYKLLNYFDSVLQDYNITNSNGEKVYANSKRIYAPNFIYVKKGKAIRIEQGISEKQIDSRDDLTKEIIQDEEDKFNDFFKK